MVTFGQVTASGAAAYIVWQDVWALHGWRLMLGLSAIPPFLQLLFMCLLPESPRWLVAKGKVTEARKVLARIHGVGAPGSEAKHQIVEDEILNIRGELDRQMSTGCGSPL